MTMKKNCIAVVATLDTKGQEAIFICNTLRAKGAETILIDIGSFKAEGIRADISTEQLLDWAGEEALETALRKGKAYTSDVIKEALRKKLCHMVSNDILQGVLAIGGAQGTAIASYGMQRLPLGFPKVIVSTIAGGSTRFGDYVGNRDIVMIPAIGDILGLNMITRPILNSGCGAVLGMAEIADSKPEIEEKKAVAITMGGITTPCVMRLKEQLEKSGFESLVFHCNGVGYKLIDELAGQGKLAGVIDISPHEISGMLFDGLMKCEDTRFQQVYASDIPVITTPGLLDIILISPDALNKAEYASRAHYSHTAFHTHVRCNREELKREGEYLAEKLNKSNCKYLVMVPEKGFSMFNKPGEVIYDEDANQGFVQGLISGGLDCTKLISLPFHINDRKFADAVAERFLQMFNGDMHNEET